MLVHTAGGEDHLLDFFVAAPGAGATTTPAGLLPVDVHFSADAVQRFNVGAVVLRRLWHHARPRGGARALRQPAAGRPRRGARAGGARGRGGGAAAGLPVRGAGADLPLDPGVRRDLRARRSPAARRRHASPARARRPARTARHRGPGLPLRRRRGGRRERMGARPRRPDHARGPALLRARRARAGSRPLPRARGADQPAAVLGRHPDRRRARDHGAARPRAGRARPWPR